MTKVQGMQNKKDLLTFTEYVQHKTIFLPSCWKEQQQPIDRFPTLLTEASLYMLSNEYTSFSPIQCDFYSDWILKLSVKGFEKSTWNYFWPMIYFSCLKELLQRNTANSVRVVYFASICLCIGSLVCVMQNTVETHRIGMPEFPNWRANEATC